MAEQFENEIIELKELAADPTLESCCRRDLEDQIKIAKIKAHLAPQDRSQERQTIAQNVLGTGAKDDLDSEEGSDTEELEALRALRLQELQIQARNRSMLQSEGHGTLTTIAASKLDKVIQDSVAEHIICHFPIEGDETGELIDQRLETLAAKYLGTRFLRCPVSVVSNIVPLRFGLSSAPGVVYLYQGTIIAASSIKSLECTVEDEIEDAVERWLIKRKCLVMPEGGSGDASKEPLPFGIGGGGSSDEEDDDEWSKPCEECGRRYPHQHIRSVYRTKATDNDGSGSSEDDSDDGD